LLAVGVAHLIGPTETCRFCSRASGLPLRTCARSPAQTVGGLSSRTVPIPMGWTPSTARPLPAWLPRQPGSLSRLH